MSNLIACLRADHQLFLLRACKAFREEWELEAKFNIVTARLRAEPLGWCPLRPKIECPIEKIESHGRHRDCRCPFEHALFDVLCAS